jgi:hypothetical protein
MDNSQVPSPKSDPALIQKFIDLQQKEMELRSSELILKKQQDDNSFEYAKLALDAQAKDRESERNNAKTINKHRYYFASFIIGGLFLLFIYALYLGKDAIVTEIIDSIVKVGIGGIGGYAWAKVNNNTKKEE